MSLSLFNLLHLCDPSLPIGGFSHSAGLETYVQQGLVGNKDTAKAFISQMLSRNLLHNDAAYLSLAFDAVLEQDMATFQRLDAECHALKIPFESRSASQKLALRLLKLFSSTGDFPPIQLYLDGVQQGTMHGHYCLAFAVCAVALQLDKTQAITGFYYNATSSMATNCVKLIPLSQTDGQQIVRDLLPLIDTLVKQTLEPDPALLGACCSGFDLRAMQHETLYSRLYMS